MSKKKTILIRIMLLATAIIWGFSFVTVKSLVAVVPTFFFLALRFTAAGIILSLLFVKKWKAFNLKYMLHGFISGAFLFAAFAVQTEGLRYTTPGKNAFLTAVYCVLVPFFFWAATRKKPNKSNMIAAFVCLVGIGLSCIEPDFSVNKGDGLTLISGVLFALHIVSVSLFLRDKEPVLFTVQQFIAIAVFAWIFTLLFEQQSFQAWNTDVLLEFAFIVIACSVMGFTFQVVGQKHAGPSIAALILSLEAVFGVLFSVLYGLETLNIKIVFGFVLILAAVVIAEARFGSSKEKLTEVLSPPD